MANLPISTGQITLIDLTDQRPVSFYLQANQPKIQVYDVNASENAYSPDYSQSNLEIKPRLFFGNEEQTQQLTSQTLTYTINGMNARDIVGVSQSGSTLTIVKNIGSGTDLPFNALTLKIEATIGEKGITDPSTQVTVESATVAQIEFARVDTGLKGENGLGITNVVQLYKLSDSDEAIDPPTPTDRKGWSEEGPKWDGTKVQYLWVCIETIYSDNTKSYSNPYTDPNWKTAADAVNAMESSFKTLSKQVEMLQDEVDSAIETWYYKGNPNSSNAEGIYPWGTTDIYPWGNNEADKHIGDLYYDTEKGYSYRFLLDTDDQTPETGYVWMRIADSDITAALDQIEDLTTIVDGKVAIYYDETDPSKNTSYTIEIDDLWIKPDGNFYQWNGTKWNLANKNIDRIEIEYNKNQSNLEAPAEDDPNWSINTPDWEVGYYVWSRTVTYYKDDIEPKYSEPSCISVAGAKGDDALFAIVESTSGRIIFTDDENGRENINLSAKLYCGGAIITEGVTYKWSSVPASSINGISNINSGILEVATGNVPNATTFTCTITYNDVEYVDAIVISDKTDAKYIIITSSQGDKFTNNNIDTILTCHVYDSHGEIDPTEAMKKYEYIWEKYENGKKVSFDYTSKLNNSQANQIKIGNADVTGKAVFACSITNKATNSK